MASLRKEGLCNHIVCRYPPSPYPIITQKPSAQFQPNFTEGRSSWGYCVRWKNKNGHHAGKRPPCSGLSEEHELSSHYKSEVSFGYSSPRNTSMKKHFSLFLLLMQWLVSSQITQGESQKSCSKPVAEKVTESCQQICQCRPPPPLPPPPPPPPPPRLLVVPSK